MKNEKKIIGEDTVRQMMKEKKAGRDRIQKNIDLEIMTILHDKCTCTYVPAKKKMQ